ncbi:hypothetical protein IFM89_034156 [Coptis chinensis]|uniref:Uncharacterized protein n=1 Tax=Coptis chinensis TaxID=261450 RepID=A0A835LXK5_9MAGN|nr:hypothetical protein IFM89_034156 [Coptis chinensis]
MQTRTDERWDSSYFYEEINGINSIMDPIHTTRRKPQHLVCKQEIEFNNVNFFHCDPFVQLPQLESPSPPLIKHPILVSLLSENYKEDDEAIKDATDTRKVTDWRALDKFVASQLSPEEDRNKSEGISNFGTQYNTDTGWLLSDSSRDKYDGLLSLGSDADIGICI